VTTGHVPREVLHCPPHLYCTVYWCSRPGCTSGMHAIWYDSFYCVMLASAKVGTLYPNACIVLCAGAPGMLHCILLCALGQSVLLALSQHVESIPVLWAAQCANILELGLQPLGWLPSGLRLGQLRHVGRTQTDMCLQIHMMDSATWTFCVRWKWRCPHACCSVVNPLYCQHTPKPCTRQQNRVLTVGIVVFEA
jgi:hypothetical protein